MTGRGRGKKEDKKCPDTQPAKCKTRPGEMKQVFMPTCTGKDFTGDTLNGTTKEQKPKEQKKTNHTEKMPSVQDTQKERTTKHFTEINKQQRKTMDNTEAPVQGAKAKTCAGRAKAPQKPAEEIKPTQTETPRDATKDYLKTKKTKMPKEFAEETTKMLPQTPNNTTDASEIKVEPETPKDSLKITKAKRQVKFADVTTKVEPETPKDTTKAPITTKKAKCAKVKRPQQLAEETAKIQPETLKDTTKACVPEDRCKDKAAVDSILHRTLENLKIRRNDKSAASEVVNRMITNIRMHMKQNTKCFAEVQDSLHTGSYYENLKISNPDEFDVMLPIPVDRVSIEPFGDDGAFYSVGLKRGKSTLEKFQEGSTLSANKMLKEFREEVKKCVKKCTEWEVTKKKKGCPAVTLTTNVQSSTISLDVVLCLVVKSSWPLFTKEGLKIEGWLGTKVKQDYKRQKYYLVPKYKGRGTVEKNGVLAKDTWRVSFSHIEKAILRNHGSEKTCCEKDEARCCRKDCLKLLKHLLSLLKERHPSFDNFCSYHAKTTLLHACCSRTKDSEWRDSSLSQCFQQLAMDFVDHLESYELNNFFIPTQNLLSDCVKARCKSLAHCIREECDKGFPIFKT